MDLMNAGNNDDLALLDSPTWGNKEELMITFFDYFYG
jgi:hypothetical protein